MAAAKRKTANKRSAGRRPGSKSGTAKKTGSKKAAPKKKAAARKKPAAKKAAPKKKPTAKKKPVAKKAAAKKRPAAKKVVGRKKPAAKKVALKKKPAKKAGPKNAAPKNAVGRKKLAAKPARKPSAAAKKAAAKKAPEKRVGAIKKAAATPKVRVVGGARSKIDSSSPPAAPGSKRNFGLRGAAPWVARHAAKHAEELRRRNAEPPPPGSARATLRTPKEAEQIKVKIADLHLRTSKIRALRKKLDKNFYEMGLLLAEVQRLELHEAKGFSSFEAFLDREVDLPRATSLRLIRITHTFQRETAYDFGIDRLATALAALDGEITTAAPSHPSSRGWSSTGMPIKPPIRFED